MQNMARFPDPDPLIISTDPHPDPLVTSTDLALDPYLASSVERTEINGCKITQKFSCQKFNFNHHKYF
jgi:hypothetical protein